MEEEGDAIFTLHSRLSKTPSHMIKRGGLVAILTKKMSTTLLQTIFRPTTKCRFCPDRSAVHFQCTEVHTSLHFNDVLLIKCFRCRAVHYYVYRSAMQGRAYCNYTVM